MPEPRDEMPEEPNLTPETFDDPFWQTVIQAQVVDADACERALTAQAAKDQEWYRQTWGQFSGEGLTGQAFSDAINEAIRQYYAQPRSRCACGEHRPGGLRE